MCREVTGAVGARLARLRYDEGYSSYLEVLDAERSLFNSDLAYTQTQADLFSAMVDLYKAMGGGWIDLADEITYQDLHDEDELNEESETN